MESVKATLDPLIGKPLTVTAIVDIMNKVHLNRSVCPSVAHGKIEVE